MLPACRCDVQHFYRCLAKFSGFFHFKCIKFLWKTRLVTLIESFVGTSQWKLLMKVAFGRQFWLQLPAGRLLTYAFLSMDQWRGRNTERQLTWCGWSHISVRTCPSREHLTWPTVNQSLTTRSKPDGQRTVYITVKYWHNIGVYDCICVINFLLPDSNVLCCKVGVPVLTQGCVHLRF